MAAIDPLAYLRSTPPFHALSRELFEQAARALEIGYWPAGTRLVEVGGAPLGHLYVIRRGSVRLERDGQTLQLLEEGEVFGYTSLITGKATLDAVVDDDLLAYRLPQAEFERLLSDASFAGHFAAGLAERLKNSLEHSPVATFQSDLSAEVETLVRRPAVWVDEGASVGDAARVMRRERISSVLVRGEPPGIVTDRDFRNRVVAEGLGSGTPVREVLSRPLRTVAAEVPIWQAWSVLLESGVHHLPVTRGGALVGVLSSTDLVKCSAQGPMAVLRRVERLSSRESLPGYAHKVTEMAAALLAASLDAAVIAGLVARLNDALLRRILAWTEADLGAAPAPYAWVVFGAEGRMEQTLLTDQDNALVYADEGGADRAYWQSFAERVNADLEAAGFPRCPGGLMAFWWHGTRSEWVKRFEVAVNEARPQDAAMLFDFRRVAGELSLEPLEVAMARAAREQRFLRYFAKQALQFGPASLLRLRGGASVVDLKLHGLFPIVFLARCYAAEVGTRARGTLERLDAARAAGVMSEEVHATIAEAYRFLLGLRLRVQLRMLSEGRRPTSEVALSDLSAIERSRLKDSLRAIHRWQEKAAYHYQTDLV